MSVTFSVANPKLLFMSKRVLSVDECLALTDGLIQSNIDEYNQDNHDMQAFYHQPLDKLTCLNLTPLTNMGRGFELSFYNDAYHVRINTPATVFDWQHALSLLQALSCHLGRPIVSEYGDVFVADEIMQFDYKSDILLGIRVLTQAFDGEHLFCEIQGVVHPMAFDAQMVAQILSSENPAETFSELLTDNQAIDAYFAKPMLTQKDDKKSGVYVLGEDLPTILPFAPSADSDIDEWSVHFCVSDAQDEAEDLCLPFDEFVCQLTLHEYELIDAKYMLVYSMQASRFYELLAKNSA
ncbi:MAG: DUF4299 family protein [Moraxella sp.]|nr:DUF4299 family protein [Moraxella sp.]